MREANQSPQVAETGSIQGIEGVPASAAPETSPPAEGADAAIDAAWQAVRAEIRRRIQPELFETWFRRAALVELGDTVAAVAVQNAFARDWLERYHRSVIEESVEEALGRPLAVELRVDPELALPPKPAEEAAPAPHDF